MNFKNNTYIAGLLAISLLTGTAQAQKIELIRKDTAKKVEVRVDGKLFTNYFYPGEDILKKAVLYPVYSPQGNVVTRGWPLNPRPDERVDHPHHLGVWLNYEDVNGNDYWNNSDAVDHSKEAYGTIVHTGIETLKSGKKKATLVVTADWLDKNRKLTLKESTTYTFRVGGDSLWIIDRQTTLKAVNGDVAMPDIKDGMFAIRVARELEMPSDNPQIYTDASGIATEVPRLNNKGITGNYRNSTGKEGDETWGKRATWCMLYGKIKDEAITIAIIDHPENVGYPAYWHTRGYGLFSVNPLGQKIFSNGKEVLDFKLKNGESVTFKYRMIVASEHLSDKTLNAQAKKFGEL